MHRSFGALVRVAVVLASFQVISPLAAQSPPVVSTADYDRAARFLGGNLGGLVVGGNVQARWLADGRFLYSSTTLTGSEQVVVDPVRRTRTKATAADTAAAGSRSTEVGGGIATRGGGGPRTGGAAGVLSPSAFVANHAPFPHPAHRTGRAQLRHPALVQRYPYSSCNSHMVAFGTPRR
jgi:hypothetical protein